MVRRGEGKPWQDLSVLLAGCGSVGRRHARVLTDLGVRDIRACDPNAAQLANLVAETPNVRAVDSYQAGLGEEPDAVFVLTPPKLHIPMAIEALDGGSNVFCEKPLADTSADVPQLRQKLAERDLVFMVGLCFRFHEGVLAARSMLEEGRIGRLVSLRGFIGEHMPDMRPDYRDLFSARYSGAFDCMHDIDLVLWFADREPREVRAIYGTYSDIGIEAPDLVEILLDFPDRTLGTVHLDFFQRPRRRYLELVGTEGQIMLEFAAWDECTVSLYEVATGQWQHDRRNTRRNDMFADEDRAFLSAVAMGSDPGCGIDEALRSILIVEAAQNQG
jgi:predicted dehydrogenase